VPLLLHAAWQQHAEAVLREYLLASMDADPDSDPFTLQAMATDALALLAEHVPQPDVGIEPGQIMSNAAGPNVSSPRVEVRMTRGSVPHFKVLDTIMDTAHGMCQHSDLLVPVVQPELRALRRWMCGQVLSQAAGDDPAPWPPPGALDPPSRADLGWDTAAVSDSVDAMVAADDTDLIVAVSPGAVRLLGYDNPEQLVGQRLVNIIPGRYRQAHLAGFTLHLLTGRSPLLAGPVTVPALRRDGTEARVELSVETHHVGTGRVVFLATMRGHAEHSG
jgi:PAS domain S-box-containing protein